MAGTKAGGKKAALTNKERRGQDYYSKIGSKGGKNGHTGGFFGNKELASKAGAKGGSISKREDGKRWYELNEDVIEYMLQDGFTIKEISDKLGVRVQKIYYSRHKYHNK